MISENIYYTYIHYTLDTNEVFYVGKGKNKRAYSLFGRNKHWHNIVKKHGYKIKILDSNLSFEEANLKEIELIKFYGRRDLGTGILCNLTDGGEGGYNVIYTQERKNKMSVSNQGKLRSKETKNKISQIKKELFKDKNNHPCTGKPRSQVTKNKLSENGKKLIGDKNPFFGKKHSEETKKLIGEKSKGRKANLGNKHSEVSKQKMRDAWVIRKEKAI